MTAYDDCVRWVREREAIRVRKEVERLPPPWTDDPILREWRFCCVRREDDRVTRWIDANIRRPFADHEHLWFMLCAARAINWPGSLWDLMGVGRDPEERPYPSAWPDSPSFEPSEMGEAMEDIASMGLKVFTGAYIITAPQTKGAKKTRHVAEVTLGVPWRDREKFARYFEGPWPKGFGPNAQGFFNLITRYDGWGPFMAYQVVMDLYHTRLLRGASDRFVWAAAGPGTIRGLNRIAGRPVDAALSQERALSELRALLPRLTDDAEMTLELYELTGVMCETDKYLRVKNKEGEPRARYVPGRGF